MRRGLRRADRGPSIGGYPATMPTGHPERHVAYTAGSTYALSSSTRARRVYAPSSPLPRAAYRDAGRQRPQPLPGTELGVLRPVGHVHADANNVLRAPAAERQRVVPYHKLPTTVPAPFAVIASAVAPPSQGTATQRRRTEALRDRCADASWTSPTCGKSGYRTALERRRQLVGAIAVDVATATRDDLIAPAGYARRRSPNTTPRPAGARAAVVADSVPRANYAPALGIYLERNTAGGPGGQARHLRRVHA